MLPEFAQQTARERRVLTLININ